MDLVLRGTSGYIPGIRPCYPTYFENLTRWRFNNAEVDAFFSPTSLNYNISAVEFCEGSCVQRKATCKENYLLKFGCLWYELRCEKVKELLLQFNCGFHSRVQFYDRSRNASHQSILHSLVDQVTKFKFNCTPFGWNMKWNITRHTHTVTYQLQILDFKWGSFHAVKVSTLLTCDRFTPEHLSRVPPRKKFLADMVACSYFVWTRASRCNNYRPSTFISGSWKKQFHVDDPRNGLYPHYHIVQISVSDGS